LYFSSMLLYLLAWYCLVLYFLELYCIFIALFHYHLDFFIFDLQFFHYLLSWKLQLTITINGSFFNSFVFMAKLIMKHWLNFLEKFDSFKE
jgi:hypothetical protein